MANKKKKDDGGWILMVAVILFLVAILIVIAPIFLLIASIYFTLRYKSKYAHIKGTYEDFWLTKDQKEQFKKWSKEMNVAGNKIEEAHQLAREHEVSINQDGRYSARSEMGKKVQRVIDENSILYKAAFKEQKYIANLPTENWNQFFSLYRNYFAYRVAIFAYLLILVIVCQFEEFNLSIQNALRFGYNLYLGYGDKQYGISKFVSKENWFAMLIITFATIVVFYISRIIAKKFAKKITPEPPLIDLEIIDEI